MEENRTLRDYKLFKIIQLIVVAVLELSFLIILISNRTLRESIFYNKSLFSLCVITYILMVLFLISICVDIYQLRSIISDNHSLQKQTYLDNLTGIPNRYSLDLIFANYNTPESLKDVGCLLFEIDNLSEINAVLGRDTGDKVLQDFSLILEEICDKFGFVGRNGGNEFIVVINNCDQQLVTNCIETIQRRITVYNAEKSPLSLIFKYAYTLNTTENASSVSSLLALTYQKTKHTLS